MNKKTIILIIIVIAAGAGVLWYADNYIKELVINNNNNSDKTNGDKTEEIDTSGWQTYRNEEYGLEVKYPGGLNAEVYNHATSPAITFKNNDIFFEVIIYKNAKESLDDFYYLDMKPDSRGFLVDKEATIFKAPKGYCDGPGCGFPFITYSVKENNDIYNLVFYGDIELSEIENEILKSFKFIDKKEMGTSGWQTYRNEEYGFELKYPGEWKILQDIKDIDSGTPLVIKWNSDDSCFFNIWITDMKIGKPLNEEFIQKDSIKINNFITAEKVIYNVVENLPIMIVNYVEFSKDKNFYTIKFPVGKCSEKPEKIFNTIKFKE